VPQGTWELLHLHERDFLAHLLDPVIVVVGGLQPTEQAASHALEALLILGSVVIAVAGIWLANRLWGRGRGLAAEDLFASRAPRLQKLIAEKYRVDELYDRLFVRPLGALARICWKVVDELIIDGGLNVAAFLTEITGDLGRFTTTGNVRNYATYFFVGALLLFWWMVS